MRIAPVRVVVDDPFWAGCDFDAITHRPPTGGLAAGAMAVVVARLLGGADLEELEARDVVEALADDLARLVDADGSAPAVVDPTRYPAW